MMTPASSPRSHGINPGRRSVWLRIGGLAVLVAFLGAGCTRKPPAREEKAIEVDVTTPITDDVLDFEDFTGRLEAHETVDVRPRVSGYILKAPFEEGDRVKKGDLLFQIDPPPYEADFALADANVNLAIAERNLQEANAGRARTLMGTRGISREEYDQTVAARDKSKASELAMIAARKKTSILLAYTKLLSPLTGRISRRAVDPGNLVKADETLLTTIVADEEVYAYFDVDERTYLDLTGQKVPASSSDLVNDLKVPVLMRLANEEKFELEEKLAHKGRVDFVDNRLNGNTGTIRMRAVFPNPTGTLKSGLFVRVRLPIGRPYKALLIPDEAIQSDQGKKYVFVIDAEEKAEYRPVTQGQSIQGQPLLKNGVPVYKDGVLEREPTLRVIKTGLKPGERVVINGMQRVQRQKPVQATLKTPPKSPGFPLGKVLYAKTDNAPK